MRWIVSVCALMMLAGAVGAQTGEPPSPQLVTRGEFALAVCRYLRLPQTEEVGALIEVKKLELVPEEWTVEEYLLYSDLDEFLARAGAPEYAPLPSNQDKPVTRDDANMILRRYQYRMRDYHARRVGHGISVSHVIDEGVDRSVSPIYPH